MSLQQILAQGVISQKEIKMNKQLIETYNRLNKQIEQQNKEINNLRLNFKKENNMNNYWIVDMVTDVIPTKKTMKRENIMREEKQWVAPIQTKKHECKSECKCKANNQDFMTTLKSLYDKIDSKKYDMEMLAEFIIDCEETLKKPKLMVKFSINDEEFLIKGDTYKEIVDNISKMIIPKVYPMLYSIEWTDKDYHYIKSNDIKVIYNMLSNLD